MGRIRVCDEGDIAPGGHRIVDIGGGIEVAVFNVDGTYYAIEDICTHDDAPLADGALDGRCIECPRHGARFDLATGEALSLPAYRPVETFPVIVDDGAIWVED